MIKSPFDQTWMIELYGNLILSVELMGEGFMTSMVLSAHESSSFVSFGGEATFHYDFHKKHIHCIRCMINKQIVCHAD